jgi:hypothetical protein
LFGSATAYESSDAAGANPWRAAAAALSAEAGASAADDSSEEGIDVDLSETGSTAPIIDWIETETAESPRPDRAPLAPDEEPPEASAEFAVPSPLTSASPSPDHAPAAQGADMPTELQAASSADQTPSERLASTLPNSPTIAEPPLPDDPDASEPVTIRKMESARRR